MKSRSAWMKTWFYAALSLGFWGAVALFSTSDALAQTSRTGVTVNAAVSTGSTYVGVSSTSGSGWRDSRYRHPAGSRYYRSGPPRVIKPAPRPRAVFVAPHVHRRPVIATSFVYQVVPKPYYPAPVTVYRTVEIGVSSPAPPVGYQVSVAAALLNVRSGPDMNQSIIGTIRTGEVLTVEGKAPGWLFVSIAGGGSGWVMEHYTRPLSTYPAG